MRKITNYLFSLILSIHGCSQNKQNQTNINIENDNMVKETLMSQLKDGDSTPLGDEYESHNYSQKDLDATINIINKILVSQGYTFPTQLEFNHKIKLILNRIIDNKSDKKYLYVDLYDKCNRDEIYSRNPIYNGIFIVKNNYFITSLYAIPELIDYQKEYPETKSIEDKKIIKSDSYWTEKLEIPHWKEIKNLSQRRYFNKQRLISRNKYLFNDDKSQFPWLVMHDEFFMRSLVTEFGYTEDKKLLKWVIENTDLPLFSKFAETKHLKELGKLLWTKDCNGEIRVHQNTLDLLKELSTPHDDLYIMYVAEYLSNYMASFAIKEENLTIEQKAKIAAYLLYWGEQYKYDKHYDYNQMFMTRFYYYHFEREAYEKEFKKNNYYGLPKFKEWYDAAKKEKDYFNGGEGMEDDPNPYDYRRIAEPIK